MISVNASLYYERQWSQRSRIPKATQVLSAVSSIQMERYNADSVQLVHDSYEEWQRVARTEGQAATFHFIEINIASVANPTERAYLNASPTNFSLTEEQSTRLIHAARQSLRQSPEFQQFLASNSSTATIAPP